MSIPKNTTQMLVCSINPSISLGLNSFTFTSPARFFSIFRSRFCGKPSEAAYKFAAATTKSMCKSSVASKRMGAGGRLGPLQNLVPSAVTSAAAEPFGLVVWHQLWVWGLRRVILARNGGKALGVKWWNWKGVVVLVQNWKNESSLSTSNFLLNESALVDKEKSLQIMM